MTASSDSLFDGRVSFCVGTGRCGTTLISKVAGLEPDVASSHERERLGATFHMFCKWHHIAIDSEGFLQAREKVIRKDLEEKQFSFESSALLSHSLEELHDRFGARFLLLVRNPLDTVASFAVRGWFLRLPARSNPGLPPSYQDGEEPRHFLGRNIPNGSDYDRWAKLTQIGKLAWFWNARNLAILKQFSRMPLSGCQIVRLEDLAFNRYQEVAAFLGWRSQVAQAAFADLAQSRPNAGPNPPRHFREWSDQEGEELAAEVGPLAEALGYRYRASELKQRTDSELIEPGSEQLSLSAVLSSLSPGLEKT